MEIYWILLLLIFIIIILFIRYKTINTSLNILQENLILKSEELVKYKVLLEKHQQDEQEKIALLKDNDALLKTQFKNLATEILDKNNEKFNNQSQTKLNDIIKPMQVQLSEFKKTVEKVYIDEAKERSALANELKTLKELNQKISIEAHNLTTALKGNNKSQGSWGEMILENVLQHSGLRVNEEYFREKTFKNKDGVSYRPDVVVNLPNDRQVIIDAKTSLVDYEAYTSSSDENLKKDSLKAHINSINKHIKELAAKEYENLKDINTLDFIFMFIPIESSLMLALEHDKNLFDKAFAKKIVLVSPATLLIALKAVENSWRYEKQARNTEEVVRLASKLYDKVRGFVDDFEKIGNNLNTAQATYDNAYKKLTSGKDNIIRQIEVFKDKSEIKPKKIISKDLLN